MWREGRAGSAGIHPNAAPPEHREVGLTDAHGHLGSFTAVKAPSKDMHVAREYLSEPAWLRLSRPRPVTPQASSDSVPLGGKEAAC